jgi:hypothetical protein
MRILPEERKSSPSVPSRPSIPLGNNFLVCYGDQSFTIPAADPVNQIEGLKTAVRILFQIEDADVTFKVCLLASLHVALPNALFALRFPPIFRMARRPLMTTPVSIRS